MTYPEGASCGCRKSLLDDSLGDLSELSECRSACRSDGSESAGISYPIISKLATMARGEEALERAFGGTFDMFEDMED